jgi:hypothetical protein
MQLVADGSDKVGDELERENSQSLLNSTTAVDAALASYDPWELL